MSPAQAVTSQEVLSPLVELYRSGQADAAVDAFMEVVGGPGWDASVERTVPGGPGQARKDATTFFEVELPALGAWSFDEASARRITQPVLYVGGGDSAPFFGEYTQWFCSLVPHTEQVVLPGVSHLLQMQSPDLVADTVARFLAAHPIE